MSLYSEVIGSFQRSGNFPLEAEYIFDSIEALNTWAEDPINYATLHVGLFKVVLTDEKQTLYWVVNKDEKLVFEPFSGETITNPEEEEFVHFDIDGTSFDADNQILVVTFKLGDETWNEMIPLTSVINYVKDLAAADVAKNDSVIELQNQVTELQGQVAALIAAGGSGGATITSIKLLTFKFADTDKTTYVVDPNKLTEEQLENGIDIPLVWEYNINLTANDKQYLFIGGKQTTVPKGTDTSYTLTGIKGSTSVYLQGISKNYGLETTSSILKITFGITIYVGGGSTSASLDSLSTQVITPSTDSDGNTYVSIPFESQTTDDFRYFAIPDNVFEEDPRELVLRDENNFVITGYTIETLTSSDGTTYYVYKLDNILHGSFTIKISE